MSQDRAFQDEGTANTKALLRMYLDCLRNNKGSVGMKNITGEKENKRK